MKGKITVYQLSLNPKQHLSRNKKIALAAVATLEQYQRGDMGKK